MQKTDCAVLPEEKSPPTERKLHPVGGLFDGVEPDFYFAALAISHRAVKAAGS